MKKGGKMVKDKEVKKEKEVEVKTNAIGEPLVKEPSTPKEEK